MNTILKRSIFMATVASVFALSACGKKEAPPPAAAPPVATTPAPAPAAPMSTPATPETSVVSVQLGTALDANGMVATQSSSFTPKDTIYAVVSTSTSGSMTSTITAKWAFQDGQVVNSSQQNITTNGQAHTSFHISKPDGFPAGKYTLEISVDGKVANTASFEVK
ncbi:MAG: hypothetical protein ABI304_06020 [Rudaea sp.]